MSSSLEEIGKNAGCSDRTVLRAIKLFKSEAFDRIDSVSNAFDSQFRCNIYHLNKFFFDSLSKARFSVLDDWKKSRCKFLSKNCPNRVIDRSWKREEDYEFLS